MVKSGCGKGISILGGSKIRLVLPIPVRAGAIQWDFHKPVAELELAVKYKSAPARVGLATMAALMPVWALFVPFLLGAFIRLALLTNQLNPWLALLVMAVLVAIPVLAVCLSAFFEDDRIVVSKEGLSFPLMFLPFLGARRERLWSDLRHVGVRTGVARQLGSSDCLTFQFRSGGWARLPVSRFSNSDLEQLLLAVEVWGTSCQRSPELIDFQNTIQNENKGIAALSYTQMWEEELRRRFSATAFVPLEPGRELLNGRLKVVRQLAFGGLSAIYLAQEKGVDLVVLKEAVVPAGCDEQSKEKASQLFEREAQLLVRMNHKQIARVLDHFSEEGRNYLVLEYVNGQDLRQLVKQNGAQSEEAVLDWGIQIAHILEYLHGAEPPVIHRDLTPDNLVLKEEGTLILIDFGAANEFVGTATGTLVGKQAYISPEQFRGKAVTESDIYSFGCTLYYLLTGSDPEALSVSHPILLKPEISPQLDELVAQATALNASERPPAGVMRQRLSAFRQGRKPVVST